MITYRSYFQNLCALISDEFELTRREAEVLSLLAKGRTSGIIAERLSISPNTARVHIRNVYQKLGVRTQQQLIDVVEEADEELAGTPE